MPLSWGITADGYVAFADDAELLKGACGKSLASFPQGNGSFSRVTTDVHIYIYIYSLPKTVNRFNGGHWVLQDVSSPQQWEN